MRTNPAPHFYPRPQFVGAFLVLALALAGLSKTGKTPPKTQPQPQPNTYTGFYSGDAARQCAPVSIWRSASGRLYLTTSVVPYDAKAKDRAFGGVRIPESLVEFVGAQKRPAGSPCNTPPRPSSPLPPPD
jgi:hypothetical protein